MISNNVLVVDQDGNTSYSSMLTLDLRNYNFVKEIKNTTSINGTTIDQNYYQINTNKTYILICNLYNSNQYNVFNGFIIVDNKDNYDYNINSNNSNINVYFKYNPIYTYSAANASSIYIGQLFIQYKTNNPGYIIPYNVRTNMSGSLAVWGTVSVYESI